jgi:AcrR family transcriptional regulator
LLRTARELIAKGGGELPTAGAIAARAGVSRLTLYDHFGSHAGLMRAVSDLAALPAIRPEAGLRAAIATSCEHWATDPALFRRLQPSPGADPGRPLANALAAADQLRPGCSLREAEDVISLVTSFSAFDRLHHDGRRSPAAVSEILFRMASAILVQGPA